MQYIKMKFVRKYGYRVTSKVALKLGVLNLVLVLILYTVLFIKNI